MDQNSEISTPEDPESETVNVQVTAFVEQVIKKLAEQELRLLKLEKLLGLQQQTLEKLGEAIQGHQAIFDAISGKIVPPSGEVVN